MGIFSPYEIAGIDTGSDGRRYPHGAGPDGFDPQYLCLAYIRVEADGAVVRHAYFPMPPDLEAFATAEFASLAATRQWSATPIRSEVNFENFTFGSQQLIVFHVDPAGAPVRFDPDNLVQFAEWSARGPKTQATRKSRNNSFFNPEVRLRGGIEMLSLENWYVDDTGQPIPPGAAFHYAMNLHALARCALAGAPNAFCDLPLVLDPDTGNMGSNP